MTIISITPDKEKAKSIFKMVKKTIEMIDSLDKEKFPSHVMKQYYDVIRELSSIILLLDGYKTTGTGAHKQLIEYIDENYPQLTEHNIVFMNRLRKLRNRISYDGFFVKKEYLERKEKDILNIIAKLKKIVKEKLTSHSLH